MKRLAPEEAFLEQVLELAKLRGWRRAHFRPAKTGRGWRTAVSADGKGFPDLFLIRPRTQSVLVAELKVPPNRVTPEQRAWLDDCEACGIPAFVWTPKDIGARSSASWTVDHDRPARESKATSTAALSLSRGW